MTRGQKEKPMESLIKEIIAERRAQDEQWGGAKHDDSHDALDWLTFIRRQDLKAKHWDTWPSRVSATYRSRLVKIAALAFAAIESYDRKLSASRGTDPPTSLPTEIDGGRRPIRAKTGL